MPKYETMHAWTSVERGGQFVVVYNFRTRVEETLRDEPYISDVINKLNQEGWQVVGVTKMFSNDKFMLSRRLKEEEVE